MLDAPGRCGSVAPTFPGTQQEAEEVSEDFAYRRPGAPEGTDPPQRPVMVTQLSPLLHRVKASRAWIGMGTQFASTKGGARLSRSSREIMECHWTSGLLRAIQRYPIEPSLGSDEVILI